MAVDYTIFYKSTHSPDASLEFGWTLFLSAYDPSERVQTIFKNVMASRKVWLIHKEYGYSASELPSNQELFLPKTGNEAVFFQELFSYLAPMKVANEQICIDITGMMRPHIMFLIKYLYRHGAKIFDVLYSEPNSYVQREDTPFSQGAINEVRPVAGFEGVTNRDTSRDLLIIGAGYDDRLIAEVAESKDKADKIQMFGLPPLQPDMYQQNVVRAHRAADALGDVHESSRRRIFSPANDPFVTASILSETVERWLERHEITNLYLSPLATKPQALGFALYYIAECENTNCSIIFPFSAAYSKRTSVGVSRTWRFTVEFPLV